MFKIEFSTDNAAFDESDGYQAEREIRDILHKIAYYVTHHGDKSGMVRDSNGNTIGKWEWRLPLGEFKWSSEES